MAKRGLLEQLIDYVQGRRIRSVPASTQKALRRRAKRRAKGLRSGGSLKNKAKRASDKWF